MAGLQSGGGIAGNAGALHGRVKCCVDTESRTRAVVRSTRCGSFHPPLLPVSPRERRSQQVRAGQDVPPGRFSDPYRYVVHGLHSLLWIRPRTNSFIGSIGKSAPSTYHGLAVPGMIPVYSARDVPGPYPPTVTPPPPYFL